MSDYGWEGAGRGHRGGEGFPWQRAALVLVALIAVFSAVSWFEGDVIFRTTPDAGECGRLVGNEMSRTDCDSGKSEFLVVEKVENTQDADAACAHALSATRSLTYSDGPKHFVFCLADL